MSFSLNQVNIIGKLGGDPETRFLPNSETSITSFNVATDHSFKDKKTDKWVNETTWHKVIIFNISDFNIQSLAKGVTVHIGGRIANREYTDKDGIKRYVSEIIGDNSSLISFGKGERKGGSGGNTQQPKNNNNVPETEDDLPF